MVAPGSVDQGVFALYARHLLAHGLAVLPISVDEKEPLVRGWRKWDRPPSIKVIDKFARQFPDANVAILPGPSGVLVADVDAADQVGDVEMLLGVTPLRVATNRGRHLYYRHVRGCGKLPSNLHALGLKADLKSGNSVVVAPPSRHASGVLYRHEDCDWHALDQLPEPNLDRLHKLLEKPKAQGGRYTVGERGLALNRKLCRHGPFAETFEVLLDVARTINEDCMHPPLDDAEVMKRARQVWRDAQAGKIEPWVGKRAMARTSRAELVELCGLGRHGSDAHALLMLLRTEHGARCARGETFCIAAKRMEELQVIPGWHWKRYSVARDLLLKAGKIHLVVKSRNTGRGWTPAQYALVGAGVDGARCFLL